MNDVKKYLQSLDQIQQHLHAWENILPGQEVQNFKNFARNLKEALKEEEHKGRILRIGIIGTVKAGKSTFLNALLFDGEEILPKAATPMTASLTRLCYAEKSFARFVFYTNEDWDIIEKEAREVERAMDRARNKSRQSTPALPQSDIKDTPPLMADQQILNSLDLPETKKACYELVSQAKKNGLNLYQLLGTSKREELSSLSEAANALRDYIGSNGKYSPIVKFVELGVNNDTLKDLEIVDTPGLQDPVRSRSEETYKFLSQCDAAFLLSRSSQFLTNDDLTLLRRNLPDNGITRVSVVATQLDLGAQNEVGKTPSYTEALRLTIRSNMRTAKNLEVPQAPIPVSCYFEIIARKLEKNLPLGPEEEQVQKNISYFSQDTPKSAKEFHEYANMASIRKELQSYRQDKDRIIQEHQEARIKESRRYFLEIIESLQKFIEGTARMMRENDVSSLKKVRAVLLEIMDSVNKPISTVFSDLAIAVTNQFADLKHRILANAHYYENIDVDMVTRQKEFETTSGLWFWKKTQRHTSNVTVYVTQLADGMQLLRNYATKCEEDINATIKELLDKDRLREELSRIVLPIYRKAEQANVQLTLEEDMIILPVNSLLQELVVPKWNFDNTSYNAALQKDFAGQIENEDISRFKTVYEGELQRLCADIRSKLDTRQHELTSILDKASANFVKDIRQRLEEQINQILDQMHDRAEALKNYGECEKTLISCAHMLQD